MKRIIVGTAGHIDHGKTALIRALTGVDADRLKEEKERGITIDLGFADLTIGEIHFGFVDVPGHERFVRNMLAGAHGIDLVMLVVAADEGLMPQTREHFEICRLLEIRSGLVVINKVDLVEEDFLELVEAEVAEYVAGSFLEGAPVIRVSSRIGTGIEQLKQTLVRLAKGVTPRDEAAVARLPIDRAFTIKGFGSVVTGTLIAGSIRVGDELELLPSDGRSARVRNLQVHGQPTTLACAGERTAINLQGIDLAEIERGQVLAPAGRLRAVSLFDVRLRLLASAGRPLRTRSRVHLHLGTAESLARVVLLGQTELTPGQDCFAQLRLESPLGGLPGDHFIIRGHSPIVTIGGGTIIDATPLKHRLRDHAPAITALELLDKADPVERIALLVEMAGAAGLAQAELAARSGAPDSLIDQAAESLVRSRRLVAVTSQPWLLVSRLAFDQLAKEVRSLLKSFHQRAPLEAGIGREEVRERVFSAVPTGVFRTVINHLVERQELVAEKDLLRLATHRIALSAEEQAARDRLAQLFAESGLQPLSLEEAVLRAGADSGIDQARAQRFAQMLINNGELVRVAELVFHRRALEGLREILQRHKESHGPKLDVAIFKELTGVTRKYAIPLLEYLDRQRVTRRNGDVREIV